MPTGPASTAPLSTLAADVALALSDYPEHTREAALAIYDEMITLLLLGRGLTPEQAARASADISRQVRERLAGMAHAGRA